MGLANVLSIIEMILFSLANDEIKLISTILRRGLVGVSKYIILVFFLIVYFNKSTSLISM